jgi:hydroxybutyrate-dimer hydrolase
MKRLVIACTVAALAGTAHATQPNSPPGFVFNLQPTKTYDGVSDDLLTAGLGTAGLQGAAPSFADPLKPTAAELRRRAIYNNYRALVDVAPGGGFGVFFGPNVGLAGTPNTQGPVAGTETLAYAKNPPGGANVTLMVQIPASFNRGQPPCIVTGTSSGSRGVYGAIGAAGEWALKRGCAVAYADKGTGMGTHDLMNDTVNLIDGTREAADVAAALSNFTAPLSDARREAYNAEWPHRFAFKHAHSRDNPERLWGRYTLQAVEFAFWAINEQLAPQDKQGRRMRAFRPDNTIVIAASVSNGGGAAIAAAEDDRHGLIDGVAVAEPNVQLPRHPNVKVLRDGAPVTLDSRPLYDYFTVANLYQPCAALAVPTSAFAAGLNVTRATNRCTALANMGLVSGADTASRAADALQQLRSYGWEPESDILHSSHYSTSATPGVTVTYANAYGRFSVRRNVCDFSFASTDAAGAVISAAATVVAQIFANGNGVPPTGAIGLTPGINIVNNASLGGPKLDAASISPTSQLEDFNLDGAACLRALATGKDAAGKRLQGDAREDHERVESGIREVTRSGDLDRRPAIIVHGRADALVPTNHSSRPYVALNRLREGHRTGLRYYEIANAQHFDAFLGLPGYASNFVPMHYYGIQALSLMWDHLVNGTSLPPSQVVRTVPRGLTDPANPASPANPLAATNIPPVLPDPASEDRISVLPGLIDVPN